MQSITFTEEDHRYEVDGREYISVTTLIDRYVPEFDRYFWSCYKAIQRIFQDRYGVDEGLNHFNELRDQRHHSSPGWIDWMCTVESIEKKDLHSTQEIILHEWFLENENSLIKGSAYHDKKEAEAYKQKFSTNPFTKTKFKTAQKKHQKLKSLKNLEAGYYPEMVIWNNKYKVIGTADRVFINRKKEIWIDDYKTNKEIKKSNQFEKMLSPLDSLDNCNYNHYRLQIGLYAWMLEQHGYDVKGISINHDGNHMRMRYNSIKRHVEKMLRHYAGEDIMKLKGVQRYGFSDIHIN